MEKELEEQMPTLTLDPFGEEEKKEEVKLEEKPLPESDLQEENLTEEEKKLVNDFSEKIDITNSQLVLQYGAAAQNKISGFSESTLDKVKTKDLGEIGDAVSSLVAELKEMDDGEENKGFFGMFKKSKNKIEVMKAKYSKVGTNVDRITRTLEGHQVTLLKDIAMLDQMYDLNMKNYKELSLYILAGKKKLEKAKNEELPKLVEKAKQTGDQQDTQAANDYASMINRFEKKIHDLELTKVISLQMAPQIRLIQNNDSLMSEKIQSTLINTIPLWKNQMVLSLGVAHATEAAKVQREVTDMTNELLRKNSEILKTSTMETAKESERGIVDIETLKATNESLISTLDEILNIQTEGRQKRREAEIELRNIENQLKEKLIDFK